MNPEDFVRLANNFYNSRGLDSHMQRIALDSEFINYYVENQKLSQKKYKVALVFICLNPLYWQYAPEMVAGAKKLFLPGHKTDFFFWTDIPENKEKVTEKLLETFNGFGVDTSNPSILTGNIQVNSYLINLGLIIDNIETLRDKGITLIPTEPVEWPYPTLLRYNLFLQEEEKLKEYDYIFYCDIDMQFVAPVGDEILGQGITAAQHPMYALRKEYWPPYEPSEESASYIKRPGRIINENGQKRFMPLYFAGGFQGGKSDKFIEAMKECKDIIEKDLNRSYIPIWNDETAWNKYLSENPPDVVLSPSYIYPDSLIKEYYEPLWGRGYQPKLVTLTKWFSTSKEGGEAVQKMIQK